MKPSISQCTPFLLFALLLTISTPADAQNDINIWYFGTQAGLDFNIPPATPTSPAEVTTNILNSSEGSAVMTDRTTGALLFYTNGIQVVDRTNTAMPNSTGVNSLGGGPSSTQAALAVPDPGNANRYYIFTTPDLGSGPAEFNIVDMTLRGGLGDVSVRRQAMPTINGTAPSPRVCEKIAATRDAAGTGFWIVFHEWNNTGPGSNAFYAYHLSASGIDGLRVSNVGTLVTPNASNTRGELKISPDGTWLATANEAQFSELYRFNNATGAITFVVTLDAGQQHYGVSFSPNSRLLYINDGWIASGTGVHQFNLSNPSDAVIVASRVRVGTTSAGDNGGMQIGPDGRIYIATFNVNTISAINCPNVPGVGCGFVDVAFTFSGTRRSSWGMPNLILESAATPQFAGRDTTTCADVPVQIGQTARPGHTYLWAANSDLSDRNIANPVASPGTTATYTLEITTPQGCIERDTVVVTVNPLPSVVVTPDVTICDGDAVQLNASGGTTYVWTPATGLSDPNIPNPIATPTTTTQYRVTVTSAAGCSAPGLVTVTVNPKPTVTAGGAQTICDGESTQLSANASAGVTFLWEPATGLDNPAIANPNASPTTTTTYSVIVTNANGCRDTATQTVTVNPRPTAVVSPDATICDGESTQLVASGGATFRWEPTTGLSNATIPNPTANPTATTTYSVIVTSTAGCSDTAQVTVTVNPKPVAVLKQFDTVCQGQSITLDASGGTIYRWSPATGLSDTTIPNPVASPTTNTVYTVIVENASGCRDTASIAVTVKTASVQFSLIDTLVDPHARGFRIPITMTAIGEPSGCLPDSFTVELEFNASHFFPQSVSRGTITRNQVTNGRRVLGITFGPGTPLVSGVLAELTGDVMLSDSIETPLHFRSIRWNGLVVTTDSVDGRLAIDPICLEGGPRLLEMGDAFGIAKIVPNPSGGRAVVTVKTVELGATSISVYSQAGIEVYSMKWVAEQSAATGGETREIALPEDLPSGIYHVQLRTPARRDVKSFIITK